MKKVIILSIAILFINSCKLFSQTKDNLTLEDYKEEIIGTWTHENTSSTKLIFTSRGVVKRYYGNTLKSIEKYAITKSCDNEIISQGEGYFLKITSNNGVEFCSYIEGLNYENSKLLSLMTKNQGKIIIYKKQ